MAVALVGIGTGVSLAPQGASADMDFSSHVRQYSYDSLSCTGRVDPVSVLFYQNSTTSAVNTHAGDHGSWTHTDGTEQYFWDHACDDFEGQRASQNSYLGVTRYHMRHRSGLDYFNFGTYSAATPHRETIKNCNFVPKHAANASSGSEPGGFVRAKWDIGYNWHNWNNGGGLHYIDQFAWWGNTSPMSQCDGTSAWNDGYIDYVEIN